jgi:cation transport regulator ChaC
MNRDDFFRTAPTAERLGRAVLTGYKLGFTRYSSGRNGGVADIIPDPQSIVEGILYRICEDEERELDYREGVAVGIYERLFVTVEFAGQRLQDVLTYTICEKSPYEFVPSERYARIILDGADELSDDYRQFLANHIHSLRDIES